jgi:5-methylthioadenosine/S-adenosylhomocysteine deaminase
VLGKEDRNVAHVDPSHRSSSEGRKGPDLIIEGGLALTMKEGQDPIPQASIWVKDGKIAAIGPMGAERHSAGLQVEIIDATECLVMPGLINAHTHAAMTLFRGLADDLPLKQWLFERIFPAEAKHLNPDTVYWGALLGCLEMIASGTTCLVDGYFFENQTARAVLESGLRALVAQGVIDFPAPGVEDPRENLAVARDFIERWNGCSDLITPGMFCHSPLTCSKETLENAWEISQGFGVPLQIHLSETSEEVHEVLKKTGERPVHYLDGLGLIDPGLIAIHVIHLDDSEIVRLGQKGVKVVHVPESNMKLSSGVARICDMIKKGITVGLGTDGCSSNNNLDLFEEMDTAAKLSKVFSYDPVGLRAETVVHMATSKGAAVLGLDGHIGTLETGKNADIIVIDLQSPHLCPVYDTISALVYTASGADVRDVIVEGRVLLRNREFLTLDREKILREVRDIAREIGEGMDPNPVP